MPRKPMPIRDLFYNTGERSAGSAVAVWACRRCGWKLVDNATRFARHILRCPSTQPGDRSLAKDHLASLGKASAAQLEAISTTADEFGRAFSLEGRAQIRSLFEDTHVCRSGEKARLFRCKRCGHESTENATRFAQHILKCDAATDEDKAVASEHQALTARRRQMRQAKQGLPVGHLADEVDAGLAHESIENRSSPPSATTSETQRQFGSAASDSGPRDNDSTEAQDASSKPVVVTTKSSSPSFAPPLEFPNSQIGGHHNLEEVEERSSLREGRVAAMSELSDSLLRTESLSMPYVTDSDLLTDGGQDIMNLDFLDCFVEDSLEEELAKLQQPSSATQVSQGVGTPQLQTRTPSGLLDILLGQSSNSGMTDDRRNAQPAHNHAVNHDSLHELPSTAHPLRSSSALEVSSGNHASLEQPHLPSSDFRPCSQQPSHYLVGNQQFREPFTHPVTHVEVESRVLPSPVNNSPTPLENDCTVITPVFQKRLRDEGGEPTAAATVSISMDEYWEWKQWKERNERPKIIQIPDMEYTMFQNLYSFMLSHAMNCANEYVKHRGSIGPSCSAEMIGRAISKSWTGLASVYRTMITCCANAVARFVLEKASTCPERIAGIINSSLEIAQDCLNYGVEAAIVKWKHMPNLDMNQKAAYQGLEQAFQHLTMNDDGTRSDLDHDGGGIIMLWQRFTVTHGPSLRDFYLNNGKNDGSEICGGTSHIRSRIRGSLPPQGLPGAATNALQELVLPQGEFANWHRQATEAIPMMDQIADDVRTSIAMTSYMTETYTLIGWDLMLVI